jgi:hypothetical protein
VTLDVFFLRDYTLCWDAFDLLKYAILTQV